MIVGDDELDAVQAARLQRLQKLLPARPALPVGQFHREHLAPAFPVDADRDQHRVARNDPILAHPFVAGVQDQIGIRFFQLALAKRLQRRIQPLVDGADRRGRERVPDQFLGDLLHLPRRDTLHIHLGEPATSAFSERWYRSNNSVENRPPRSCGTRSSSLPTRVISARG
jgi:hypothetical protein